MNKAATETTTTDAAQTTAPDITQAAPATETARKVAGARRASADEAFARAVTALGGPDATPDVAAEETAPAATPEATAPEPAPDKPPSTPEISVEASTPAAERRKEIERWEAVVAERRKVQSERAQLEAERAKIAEERAASAAARRAAEFVAAGDLVSAAEAMGISYKELTKQLADGKKPATDARAPAAEKKPSDVEARIARAEEELAAWRRASLEAEERRVDESIRSFVRSAGDAYALLDARPDAERQIRRVITEAWEAAGRPADAEGNAVPTMSWADAAASLERDLEEVERKRLSLDKVKKLYAQLHEPVAPQSAPVTVAPSPAPAQPPKRTPQTVTNVMSSEVARVSASADPAECRRRAIAALGDSE